LCKKRANDHQGLRAVGEKTCKMIDHCGDEAVCGRADMVREWMFFGEWGGGGVEERARCRFFKFFRKNDDGAMWPKKSLLAKEEGLRKAGTISWGEDAGKKSKFLLDMDLFLKQGSNSWDD